MRSVHAFHLARIRRAMQKNFKNEVAKWPQKEAQRFYVQLSTLLQSGMSLLQSLHIIINLQQATFHRLLQDLQSQIVQGCSFSQSLLRYPRCFDVLSVQVLSAGEASGQLAQSLQEVARYHAEMMALKHTFWKALSYPCLLLLGSLGVVAYVLLGLVPRFELFFSDMQLPLPFCTQCLLFLSHAVSSTGFKVATIVLLLVLVGMITLQKSLLYQLPGVRVLRQYYVQQRFAYVLSMVLAAGIPLSEGLVWAAKSAHTASIKTKLLQVKDQVVLGYTLTQSLENAALFSASFIHIIAVGEETGDLVALLKQAMHWTRQEVDHFLSKILVFFEPCMLIFFGFVVILLVLSIYFPFFELMAAF